MQHSENMKRHLEEIGAALTDAVIAGGELVKEAWAFLGTLPGRTTGQRSLAETVGPQDAADAMAAALQAVRSIPKHYSADGRPVAKVAQDFIDTYHGTPGVDIDGAYGPQSPDLITLYVREFQPGWLFKLPAAADLWDRDALPAGWSQISKDGWPSKGDIAVTRKTGAEPWGNLGIVSGGMAGKTRMLTQTPKGVQFHLYPQTEVLGYFRWEGV